MSHKKQSDTEFSVEQDLQIDAICIEFETQLLEGGMPRIEDALDGIDVSLRPEVLRQLLLLELEHRVDVGTECGRELYRQRFPNDSSLVDQVFADHERLSRSLEKGDSNRRGSSSSSEPLGQIAASHDNDLTLMATTRGGGPWPIARYDVQDEVARGGMGAIHRVWDVVLNRTLAMKVMFKAPRDSVGNTTVDMLNRFTNEAQVMAQLDHPGVVAVHDLGRDSDGRPFFTMKLVKGRNFSKIIELVIGQDEGWNLSRAIGVLVKVCQTVAYAHSRGIIHRDMKPANIMVGRFGEVYVMDWGLAKVTTNDKPPGTGAQMGQAEPSENQHGAADAFASSLYSPVTTLDGTVVGTPAFMSPEQARGEIEEVDQLSDIYSLGCVLYYLLTGAPPYVAKGEKVTPQVLLERITSGPPQRVARLNPLAPSELTAICEKAMNRTKADRYTTAVDLAEDLQAWLDRRVVRAYRSDPIARIKSWVQRNQATALAGMLALASLLFAFGWWVHQEREKATYLRLQLSRQYLRQAQSLCERHRVAEGLHLLVNAFTTCPPENVLLRRDIATNLMGWARRNNRLIQMIDHESDQSGVNFTDSKPLALAFSSRDQHLITGGWIDHTARIWSVRTGKPVGVPMKHESPVLSIFCAASSGNVVTHSEKGAVRLWSASGELVQVLIPHGIATIAFHAPTSRFAAATTDGRITVWSAETARQLGKVLSGPAIVSALHLTDDGARLMVGYQDGSVCEWAVETGEPLRTRLDGLHGTPVAFSNDGRNLLTLNEQGAVYLYDMSQVERPTRLNWSKTNLTRAAFSPDGLLLAIGSRGTDCLHLFSTRDGRRVHNRIHIGETVETLRFSPDSQQLVVGSHDSALRAWSMKTGFQVGQEIKTRGPVHATTFSDDGRTFALGMNGVAELWSGFVGDTFEPLETGAAVWGIEFGRTGEVVATCDTQGRVKLWSAESGACLETLNTDYWLWDVAMSADLRHVVAAGNKGALWWTPTDNHPPEPFLKDASIRAVDVCRNGKLVATAGFDGKAIVWSVPGLQQVISFDHPANVEDLAISPDGQMLATACGDGRARLWSIRSGEEIQTPLVHNDAVLAVRLSSDGRIVATGSRDRTARLWNWSDGVGAVRILQHSHWVEDLEFVDQSPFLVTACRDGNAQRWSIDTGEKIGPPFEHQGAVRAIASYKDQIVTGTTASLAFRWRLHDRPDISPTDYGDWVRRITGCRMDPIGVVSHLSPKEWTALDELMERVEAGLDGP